MTEQHDSHNDSFIDPAHDPELSSLPVEEQGIEQAVESPDSPNRSTVPVVMQLTLALSILGGLFGLSYIPWVHGTFSEKSTPTSVEEVIRAREARTEAASTSVTEPKVEAVSAYVWDVKEQRALYNKNASAQVPLASLTKLMTSLVALESLGSNANVAMTLEAIMQDGPSDFIDGETFKAKSLSDFALISSSNDGAYALAAAAGMALGASGGLTGEQAFVKAMNIRAEELGLTQTYYHNPTGLDDSPSESGAYGTARDTSFLMEYLVKNRPEIIENTVNEYTSVAGSTLHSASNTNDILAKIPGILGSKTGYTDLAGGNLVVAFNAGLDHPVVVTVLGSTREGRFRDVLSLITYAQKILANAE